MRGDVGFNSAREHSPAPSLRYGTEMGWWCTKSLYIMGKDSNVVYTTTGDEGHLKCDCYVKTHDQR